MEWKEVKKQPPPIETSILVAHVYKGEFLWISSIIIEDDGRVIDELTDDYFEPIGYRDFNYWAEMPIFTKK